MEEEEIRRERTQNLWTSFARKFPPLAKAVSLDPSPTSGFDRIGGLAGPKEEVETYACGATHPEVYEHWGTFAPSALLLIGQRGVGKHLLAQALATRAGRGFLHVHVPQLVLQLLHSAGQAGPLMAEWSQALSEMPPLAVFYDELEFSLAHEFGTRRTDLPVGPVMDFLLDLVDRTIAVESSLVIGSTSYPDTLRQAFLLPGRFERVVEVSPAYPDDVVAALRIHALDAEKRAGRPLFEEVDWFQVVQQLRDPSPGDWVRLLHAVLRRKAGCEVAGGDLHPVGTQDFLDEVDRVRRARSRLPSGGGIYL
ncbi:ATP-dependent zinc metalloprotease FtsH 1 [Myxococcaceae bacterium]|jgi:ATP-dependent 26S proteasome regulatory subunit|nr:ATP-dependent zinc metalloprotease FtsH 1 [Myxococcaceae bacterium]